MILKAAAGSAAGVGMDGPRRSRPRRVRFEAWGGVCRVARRIVRRRRADARHCSTAPGDGQAGMAVAFASVARARRVLRPPGHLAARAEVNSAPSEADRARHHHVGSLRTAAQDAFGGWPSRAIATVPRRNAKAA